LLTKNNLGVGFCWLHFLLIPSWVSSIAPLVSGGRPEGSKRNLNFQGATWYLNR
jgi:hypothetical protein